MNLEDLESYCSSKVAVTAEFPFDDVTLTFKVMGKMFAICGLNEEEPRVNLKCDPERAIDLRENFPDIIPGWHMNKKHWNTVYLERELSDQLIRELIDHSYELIVKGFSKKIREEYNMLARD